VRGWLLLWRFFKGLALTLLIVVALLNLAARVAMTQLDRFKPELALLFEDAGIQGLALDRMSGEWRGWRPRFHFEGVRLQLPGERLPSVAINQLDLTVKPFRSLYEGRLSLAELRARIDQVELERDADRRWVFNGRVLDGGKAVASAGPSPGLKRFLQWLPDRLAVDIDRIALREKAGQPPLLIRDLRLHSQRWRGGRRLQLQAQLPPALGRDLSLRLVGDWQEQRLYLEANELDLARLMSLLPWRLPQLQSARGSLRSWAEFDAFRLMRVQTLAALEDLRLRRSADAQRVTQPLQLRLKQLLMREGGDWRGDVRLHGLRQAGSHLPPVTGQLLWQPARNRLQAWVERLDLASISRLLGPLLDDPQAARLTASHPQGQLENLLLDFDIEKPAESRWRVGVKQARIEPVGQAPGLRNLSLRLSGRGRDAVGRLASRDLWVDFGDLFRDPLHASVLEADLQLRLLPDRLLLDAPDFRLSNADAALEGRLSLEAPGGQRPFLSLRATASRANASATGRYLPTRIMPPATVAWLDDAIRGGEVTRAELLFHGRTESLKKLAPRQAGEFVAWMEIERPQLQYRPGWPAVSRGRGTLEFHNLSMNAAFESVDFGEALARELRVEIPDLGNARLKLEARALNDAAPLLDSLATVKELPLFQRLREPTEAMGGPVKLRLELEIPLSRKQKRPLSVMADLGFEGLYWRAPDWLVDVTELRGGLRLENRRLRGEGLKALYAGDPIGIGIDGDLDAGRTDIAIDGRIESRRLLGLLPPVFPAAFDGRSDWTVKLSLQQPSADRGLRVDIDAGSDLRGTALTLPPPLDLAADAALPLHFSGRLTPRQFLDFRLDMAPKLRLEGRYDSIAEGEGLQKIDFLNLLLGAGEMPRGDAGMRLRGNTDVFDIDAWQAWLERHAGDIELTGEGLLSQVQQLDLDVGLMRWRGRELQDLSLSLERQGGYLGGELSSSLASGSLLWPLVSGPDTPIVIDLARLHWPAAPEGAKTDWQPKLEDMPNLVLVSRDFRWREMSFSDLVLRTRNDGRRFEVQRLDLRKDQVLLRATGHWQHQGLGGDDITVFNISIKGRRFGQTVEKLGLGETLRGGNIDFFGQIGWGGAIDDISWDTLIGEVDLTLKDGYLRNVDPGAGRFVGLLSFSALPRRLFLDFGDVLREGLQFRKIRGKFTIDGEILATDNAWMDSPSAKVRIKGITNLRTKTYDQTMYIIPKVGDTLPVIGALTGGSTLGWGILLLQKIFKKPIDKSVEIEYRVTGPWDDPKIELIEKPDANKDEDNAEPFEGHPNS
jgi:uncharacterized protein (TIGR02099 family)